MKKITSLFALSLFVFSFSGSIFSQSVYVNETDINKLDIKYCELRVGQPLNPTKVKIFVDYGQAFSIKRQNIMTPDKKVVKFNSPMHALNFMDRNGWSYVEQVAVQAGETTTYKYLMIKN
tara:strand:- start:695 stop:1054 length:360 start_codon:yes stop_codon:yes gene_type:complete